MSWNKYLLGAGLSLLSINACTNSEKQAATPAFFDLVAYMDAEQRRLEAERPLLIRESYFNGSVAEDSVNHADYSQDLLIFRRADINRPSWRDQYSTDSIFGEGGQLQGLHYRALTPSLKTRTLEIDFDGVTVKRIFLYNQTDNWIAGTQQRLIYWPDSGYLVEARQRVIWTSDDTLSMRGKFSWK
jgi:hypothetical protein